MWMKSGLIRQVASCDSFIMTKIVRDTRPDIIDMLFLDLSQAYFRGRRIIKRKRKEKKKTMQTIAWKS